MISCPVCYDDVPIAKTVSCQHGHRTCEKHHIQRAKAMYEECKNNQFSGFTKQKKIDKFIKK